MFLKIPDILVSLFLERLLRILGLALPEGKGLCPFPPGGPRSGPDSEGIESQPHHPTVHP
jgi:hypothetical protein